MIVEMPNRKYEISNNITEIVIPINKKIFLAGGIDGDNSPNWQQEMIFYLNDRYQFPNLTIFNSRTGMVPLTDEKKIEYARWNHYKMDEADEIIIYLKSNYICPFSLLQLGLYATSGKLRVFCDKDFYKHDDVQFACEQYKIPFKDDLSTIEPVRYIAAHLCNDK